MGCDMVVALGRATVNGQTLFGHNCPRPAAEEVVIRRTPGKLFALGEVAHAQFQELAQARRTFTVVSSQTSGQWGYHHGVNEHGVAVGHSICRTRMPGSQPGLTGPDLVRLSLERSPNARQAVEWITDLVNRYGHSSTTDDDAADHVFVVADAVEAFLIETSGPHWVYQEVREVRAAGDTCTIRQDWDRISVGLAGHAIEQGWWPEDGTKLDFAGTLGAPGPQDAAALRRWGRVTLLLEQQNGHIDVAFLRRILSDQFEGGSQDADSPGEPTRAGPLIRHATALNPVETCASLVAQVSAVPGVPPVVWHALGPPCLDVYFPLFLDGDLPPSYASDTPGKAEGQVFSLLAALRQKPGGNPENQAQVVEATARLQAGFDQETEEFLSEHAELRKAGDRSGIERLAGLFMQHNWESFEEMVKGLLTAASRRPIHVPHAVRASVVATLNP